MEEVNAIYFIAVTFIHRVYMGGAWSHGVTKTTNSSIKHQRRQASAQDDSHIINHMCWPFSAHSALSQNPIMKLVRQ